MIERFIFREDLRPEQTWQLLELCRTCGASEFTLQFLEFEGSTSTFCDRVRALLAPFALPPAVRPHVTAWTNHPATRATALWALMPASISALRSIFDEGLFTYVCGDHDGWVEEPEVYRDGEIVLGVVSHEQEGVLRLSRTEQEEVTALRISTRERPVWI
jgi:hypothetical protein